ncbi:MAG: hypothetical protein KatS3mg108_2758 [Isosphaeraceae bacterium]|nr:MAG: hypothetical protein KatS3mg108_2758 [Isosphaeraceae bacterium]
MATEPSISGEAGQPDGEHAFEVEGLPGGEPGVEQVLERMKISCLAFTEEGMAAVEAWDPGGEAAGFEFFGEEVAVGVVDFGDVEIEQGPAESDHIPEEGEEGDGPGAQGQRVGGSGSGGCRSPGRWVSGPGLCRHTVGWRALRSDSSQGRRRAAGCGAFGLRSNGFIVPERVRIQRRGGWPGGREDRGGGGGETVWRRRGGVQGR